MSNDCKLNILRLSKMVIMEINVRLSSEVCFLKISSQVLSVVIERTVSETMHSYYYSSVVGLLLR